MKSAFWNTLTWIQKNLVWSIPLSMAAGLLFGMVTDAAFMRSAILPLTFLMVYPMMVTMNVKELFNSVLNPLTSNRLSGKLRTQNALHSICKKECKKLFEV
jgi:ACR3 family arsenite efflux pump ArsB